MSSQPQSHITSLARTQPPWGKQFPTCSSHRLRTSTVAQWASGSPVGWGTQKGPGGQSKLAAGSHSCGQDSAHLPPACQVPS